MQTKSIRQIQLPDSEASQNHRRETFWQITLPIFISAGIIVIIAVLSTKSTTNQTSVGSDIALIWLLIPALLFGLIGLAITILFITLTLKCIKIIPPYTHRLQISSLKISKRIQNFADLSVEPIMRVQSALAILHKLTQRRQYESIISKLYSRGHDGKK